MQSRTRISSGQRDRWTRSTARAREPLRRTLPASPRHPGARDRTTRTTVRWALLGRTLLAMALMACTPARIGVLDGAGPAPTHDAGPAGDAGGRGDAGRRRDAGRAMDAGLDGGGGGMTDAGTDGGGGPVALFEGECGDGVDEDGDGATDCEDLDCNREPCASGGRVCLLGSCGGCRSEPSEAACGDAADEDCDGLRDCADPECDGQPCGPGVSCGAGACPCASGFTELLCGDTTDDDCDGQIDCLDPDCAGRSCGPFGQVCTPGGCACTGGIEFCQGGDDDCNGLVDDTCPLDVSLCCGQAGAPVGGAGGVAFLDACPTGMVLIGIAGRAGGFVDALQPLCAPFHLEVDTSTRPDFSFLFRRGPVVAGALHGGSGGAAFDERCPGDQIVIGIRGDADIQVEAISIVCSTVTIARSALSWNLSVTVAGISPTHGSPGGLGPFNLDCPAGNVVTGLAGSADSRVVSVARSCEQVVLDRR